MGLKDFIQLKDAETLLSAAGWAVFIILTVIQRFAPEGKRPWSSLAKMLGAEINRTVLLRQDELSSQISAVSAKLKSMEEDNEEDRAITARVRILIFEDELQEGRRHSKDRFDQVLVDIDNYDNYCSKHPEFKNNQTRATVAHIRRVYSSRLEKHDFTY